MTTPKQAATDQALLTRVHAGDDPQAREQMIERGLGLVHHIAATLGRPGVAHEELVQVGCVGLINAVDRFDPERGVKFSSFAVPYISGEIRRYFRDHSGLVRVTRGIQENLARVNAANERLSHELQRSPTVNEVAEACELTEEDVLEALESRVRRRMQSLDEPIGDAEGGTRADLVPSVDEGFAQVENRLALSKAAEHLQPRDRRALKLRFEDGLTQKEIAEALGVSQMHVSRCLRRAMATMRNELTLGHQPAPR